MGSSGETDKGVAAGRSAGRPRAVCFADEAGSALLGGCLGELDHPDRGHWRLIKQNPSRSVYRGDINGQKVYLKHFHSRGFFRRLSRSLGVSRAMREMKLYRYLNSRGVATPAVLAARCADGIEWLATRAVAPAEPADEWHEAAIQRGGRDALRAVRQATIALARLIGRMHAAGVVHGDLHCGNILVRSGAAGGKLVLFDLHRGRRRRLTRRMMAANLAQLLHDRCDFTTRSDRLRFLKEYLSAVGASGTLRGWRMMVEDFTRRHGRRYRSQRDRRVMGNNRYFRRIKLSRGWRGRVVLASKRKMAGSQAAEVEFAAEAWRRLLSSPESLTEPGEGRAAVLKDARSSLVVRRRITVGPHRLDVFIKQPRRKHFWKIIVDCFRPSRPMRAFKLGHALLTQRIATALPLVALERRFGPVLLDSILITEAVNYPRLHDFLNMYLARPPAGDVSLSPKQQMALAQAVLWRMGRLLQKLHDNRFAHRDLKANNMLVRWSPGELPEIVLVDLDGLRRKPLITEKRRFQGLMRLNVSLLKCPVVSRAGRLRMLLGYLRRPGCGRINFKPYWRVLEQWSKRKLQQQIRSRRHAQHALRQREAAAGPQPPWPSARLATAGRRGEISQPPPSTPHRVLIVKPSSLGDVVSAVPVLRGLRRSFPGVQISWMLTGPCAEMLAHDSDLDEVILFDRARLGKAWWLPGAARDLLRLLKRLRNGRFDWVIDLQGLFRSGFFARAAGASLRAGFADARELAGIFYSHGIEVAPPHTVDRNVALARRLGIDARPEDMTLQVAPAAKEFARRFCAGHGLQAGQFIVCVPPTRWATKRYPVRHWRKVVSALTRRLPVVLLGSASDTEVCSAVASGLVGVIDLAGKTGVAAMVGVIAAGAGVICSDSAAKFIAAAVGVEAITLMGPTRVERTGPYLRGRAIVADVPCRGCVKRRCRHVTCMQMISPDEVITAAEGMLERRGV